MLSNSIQSVLRDFSEQFGTPNYVYFPDEIANRLEELKELFGTHFNVSFAMKCNPNIGLLRALNGALNHVDASSIAEVERGIAAGYAAGKISFSGPAKTDLEITRAVELGVGAIVCESEDQIASANTAAEKQGKKANVLLRINPTEVPKSFGLHMAGRAGQFGVDEEDCGNVLAKLPTWHHIDFKGFHIFSGGNSLSVEGITENFKIIAGLFGKFSNEFNIHPKKLIFGAGFGIPYFADDKSLDLKELSAKLLPVVEVMKQNPLMAEAECMLEMGRFIVGPAGFLLTSVIGEKLSRGTNIRICDAGFNNHLSACGMMGTVIRRNWQFVNLTNNSDASEEYLLVGPLCASFDQLATKIEMPTIRRGDVLVVESSGAYGLTASPTRFISHPEPGEYLIYDSSAVKIEDVTESKLNHRPNLPSANGEAYC